MADFNAGSIEATADLDLNPFLAGLAKAKAEAEKFENDTITQTIRTVHEGDAEPEHVGDESATVSLNDDAFRAEVERDKIELDELGAKRVHPTIDIDTAKARLALDMLRAKIDSVAGAYNAHGNPLSGGGGGGHGLMYLIGLAAALAPALGPATAAFGLFSAAGIAGFAAVAASAVAYGAVASKAFEKIQDAIKAGKQLPGVAGEAETAFKNLNTVWGKFQAAVDPGVFRVMVAAFNQLASILPEFEPLINAMSKGLVGVVNQIGALFKRDDAQEFIATLTEMADKDIPKLGKIIVHVFGGLMDLFDSLSPVIQMVLHGAVQLSGEFEKWANLKSNSAVEDTLTTIQKYATLTKNLFKDLGGAIVNIGKGLAPLTGPALVFLDGLARALKIIDLKPLASGIGAVLVAATPFLKVIAQLVNVLLPPLETILKTLASSFIGPLGKSLTSELVPAFKDLAGVLNFAAPYLGQIIASFADLVNPTGVGAVTKLIHGLVPVVEQLIPPLSKIVIALESFVDDGLEVITPLIPAFSKGLLLIADALTPVLDGLAWFLSNKVVVDIILALGAAILLLTSPVALAVAAITAFGLIADFLIKHWSGIAGFFGDVWNKIVSGAQEVWGWIKGHWPLLLTILTGPFGLAVSEIIKHWGDITSFFHAIPGKIKGFFSGVGSLLVSAGTAILHGLKDGAQNGWSAVRDFVNAIPGRIKSLLGDLGGLLTGAGRAIMQGFLDGITAIWNKITSKVSGMAGWIKDHKGPVEYDRMLLVENGAAIMQGLHHGLVKEYEGTIQPWITGVGKSLSSSLGLGSDGAATFRLTGTSTLQQGVDSLADAVQALAEQQRATTDAVKTIAPAVGDALATANDNHAKTVTDAFESATDKQTAALIRASRT